MSDVISQDYRPSEDEPYMNARQSEYFRRKLLQWREDILKGSDVTLRQLKEEDMRLPDQSDWASAEIQRAFELRTRELALERQRLAVAELERQFDALTVRSPVDGQVANLAAAERASVILNAPLLTVVDLSQLELEIQVPESFADDLGVGMAAQIRYGNGDIPGQLSSVSPEVVNGQVTGRVRFAGTRPEGLRQNQRLATRILIEEKPNVLMVERGPFLDSEGGRAAYVLDGNGIATRTNITVGSSSLSAVEILSGLKPGDRIIVSGTDAFEDAPTVMVN